MYIFVLFQYNVNFEVSVLIPFFFYSTKWLELIKTLRVKGQQPVNSIDYNVTFCSPIKVMTSVIALSFFLQQLGSWWMLQATWKFWHVKWLVTAWVCIVLPFYWLMSTVCTKQKEKPQQVTRELYKQQPKHVYSNRDWFYLPRIIVVQVRCCYTRLL